MRLLLAGIALFGGLAAGYAFSQESNPDRASVTFCTFDDQSEVSVRYKSARGDREPPAGKVWAPGDTPMFLFAQAALTIGKAEVPVGAYSMYVIPGRGNWTLIVNRNVKADSPYDQNQDLVRTSMETAKMSNAPSQSQVSLGHVGPKQCEMRLFQGKTGAWVTIAQK